MILPFTVFGRQAALLLISFSKDKKHSKWGEGLLRQMSIDLKKTFSDMAGFSKMNLKTIRLWYRFYAEAVNGQQVVDKLRSDDIFQLITTIPWGHNQRIIFKCKDVREAVFMHSIL